MPTLINAEIDKSAKGAIAYGRHAVKGLRTKHYVEMVGTEKQVTIQRALTTRGPWDSNEALYYGGELIDPANNQFHSGVAGDAPDTYFPADIPHPNAVYEATRLPIGMADEDEPDRMIGIYKTLHVANYDGAGVQTGFGYSASPSRHALDAMLRCKRSIVRVNYPQWVDWRDFNAENIDWDDGALTPHYVRLAASAGGSLAAGTYWVRIATIKGADVSSASKDRANDGVTTASVVISGGNLQFLVEWASQLERSATGYRVYIGTAEGAEDRYFDVAGGGTNTLLVTTLAGATMGAPPEVATGSLVRQIPRFESHLFFVPPFSLAAVLDKIAQISCMDWQWANGNLNFLTPEIRGPVFTINAAEIQGFKTWQVDRRQKPTRVVVHFRDLDSPYLEPANPPAIAYRETLEAAEGERAFEIQGGCMYRSQANRVANYWARRLIDSDQMFEGLASPKTYIVLPADVVNITHSVPDWEDIEFCIEEKEESEDSKAGYQIKGRIYGEWYSDTDSEPLSRPLPTFNPSELVAPPIVEDVDLQPFTVILASGMPYTTVRGAVQFATWLGQRGRVWVKDPDDADYRSTHLVLTPDPATLQAAFELPVTPGEWKFRVVTESLLGVSLPFASHDEYSITITEDIGPLDCEMLMLVDEDTPAFNLSVVSRSNPALSANRKLTIDVSNVDRTLKLAGNLSIANNFSTAGNFPLTLTQVGATNVTLPTSGTLATVEGFATAFDSRLAVKTTSDLAEGANLYYTAARFHAAFAGKTTTDLAEGSNLYFTNTRADARITNYFGAMTQGSVFFAGAGGALAQDNARFFWDDANHRLGIGMGSPLTRLHSEINSSNTAQPAGAADIGLFVGNSDTTANNFEVLSFGNAANAGQGQIGVINIGSAPTAGGHMFFTTRAVGGSIAERMRITSAGNVGIGTIAPSARLHAISTSEQLRLGYDAANYASCAVSSGGNLTVAPTGNFVFNPTGNQIDPEVNYDLNFGQLSKKYLTLHAAELWVETLVAAETMATIAGRQVVAKGATLLTVDLAAADTTITVKHNNLANGDILWFESAGKFEMMAVTSGAGGSAGAYTYTVTRDLDETGANQWYAGDSVVNTGTTGDGFIELYAYSGRFAGTGPTIVGNVRISPTHNDIEPRWAIGNLNGLYGYGSNIYGAAFGVPTGAWVKIDPTNGVRIGHNATTLTQIDASGNASFTGTVTAAAGAIGGWTIGAASISSGGIVLASHATAASNKIYVGTGTYGNANTAFYVDGAGKFSLKDKLTWDGTTLSITGGGTFSGALSAASGTFAGDLTGANMALSGMLSVTGSLKAGANAVTLDASGITLVPALNGASDTWAVTWKLSGSTVGQVLHDVSDWLSGNRQFQTALSSLASAGADLASVNIIAQSSGSSYTLLRLQATTSGGLAGHGAWLYGTGFNGLVIGSASSSGPNAMLDVRGNAIIAGALEVQTTTGGFTPPKMTTAQRDTLTPSDGMMIYNTTTNKHNLRQAGAWVAI